MAKNVDCRRCPRVDIRRATMGQNSSIFMEDIDACCDKKSAKLRSPTTSTVVQFVFPPLTVEALVTLNEKKSLFFIIFYVAQREQ